MFANGFQSSRVRLLALALIGLSGAAGAQSRVWVVARSGARDFSEIQPAVNAAGEGDTILVRPPTSAPPFDAIDVSGKSLTIVVDSQTGFAEVRAIRVHGLGADQPLLLSRLRTNDSLAPPGSNPAVWLHDNLGRVSLVACEADGVDFGSGYPGLVVESSSAVVALASCLLRGGNGLSEGDPSGPLSDGLPGLVVRDSVVVAFDCASRGGSGGGATHGDAMDGGPGVLVERGSRITALVAMNTVVAGGDGGSLNGLACHLSPGSGGAGLAIGSNAIGTTIDAVLTGGHGGSPYAGCIWSGATPGPNGSPLVNNGFHNDHALDEPARSHLELRAPTVAREGQVITLSFTGTPGADVFLIAGGARRSARIALGGMLLVKPERAVQHEPPLPLGTIQPNGTLSVSTTLPQVPSGARNLWFQAYGELAGGRTMGSFSVVTVLDSIY